MIHALTPLVMNLVVVQYEETDLYLGNILLLAICIWSVRNRHWSMELYGPQVSDI